MSFVDDFDTLDTEKWAVSDGWDNGAQQNCTWDAEQVAVADGVLNLSYATKAVGDRKYACAEIQRREQRGYGTYEARIRGVDAPGLMAAMFTYVAESGDAASEAIDVKLLGTDPSTVKLNTWRDGTSLTPTRAALPGPANGEFLDYGLKWTAERMDFYVNGQVVHSITDAATIPDRETNLFLTLWGSETIQEMGPFEPPAATVTVQVDRIAYTAPGEACQFPESIACA